MKSEKTRRIAYWDNAKAILIFLVVLGHFLLPVQSDRGALVNAVYYWIYLFHIPAFVFVSGFLSKRYAKRGADDVKKIIGYFVLYALYCLPYWANTALHGDLVRIFAPTGAQWYLLCMALWHILIPYCAKIKPLPMLLISIVVSLIVGMDTGAGSFLSLSRCIVFFPFFLAGYYFDGEGLNHISFKAKIISASMLGLAFIATYTFHDALKYHSSTLYGAVSYSEIPSGIMLRFLWYIASSILVGALLYVIPKRQYVFTYIGQRTLAIYILHRPIRDVIEAFGLYRYLPTDLHVLAVCLIISAALTFILSEKHLTDIFNKAFTFDYNFLIK